MHPIARTRELPHLHTFANGLELDRAAVNAGLTSLFVPESIAVRAGSRADNERWTSAIVMCG